MTKEETMAVLEKHFNDCLRYWERELKVDSDLDNAAYKEANGIKFRFNLKKDKHYPEEEKGSVLFSLYETPQYGTSWNDIRKIDEYKTHATILLKDWADIRRELEEKVSEALIKKMSNICDKTTDFCELCNIVNNFSV